jgi:uncharacterized membrane protein
MAASSLSLASGFYPMPDLPGGQFLSRANFVSSGFVVGMSSGANGDEAVLWRPSTGTVTPLSDLPGGPFASEAFACTYDGSIVFGYGTNADGNQEAIRWTAATGMVPLGFIDGGTTSRVFSCAYNGATACGESISGPITQAFRWTQSGGMQGLGFLTGSANTFSTAHGMSGDGNVIVGLALDGASTMRPFRWTAATGMVDISGGAFTGEARACNYDGTMIVGVNQSTSRAFLWTAQGGAAELPTIFGSLSSEALAISNDARIVGISDGHACTWVKGGCGWVWEVRPSNPYVYAPGWTFTAARSADNGYTVGLGTNPAGQTQGWYAWDPSPGPQCCCGADFNCDGDVGTDADIQAFFDCLAGSCPPPPCPYNADFNGDGDVGTDADIEAFLRVLAGGCC